MLRPAAFVFASSLLLACGGGTSGGAQAATTRDSAGVAILEYPKDAWEKATQWELSPQPLMVIGGDPADTTLDLSTSQIGALLSDNRVLVATFRPAQILLFSADGTTRTQIGREGEGPGEYRFVTRLEILGRDTIAAYEAVSRRTILFLPDGTPAGSIQYPVGGTIIPPTPIGHLADGTQLFQVVNPLGEPPAGAAKYYRVDFPVLAWRSGQAAMDTLFQLPGPVSMKGSIDVGAGEMVIARPIAFTSQSFAAASNDKIWTTPGDRFELDARDATGAVITSVRMARALRSVSSADRDEYKAKLREGLERVRGMGFAPPALIESEIKKIDETEFAEQMPAIGLLSIDQVGRIWVTDGTAGVDSVLTYVVFSDKGELLGRVILPSGLLMGANTDRVVVRREDEESGLVRFEIWGLNQGS